MTTLQEAVTGPAAGIYRVGGSVAEMRDQIERAGAACHLLAGQEIASKADFLQACATAFAFPPYFGRNWDALEECLRDLAWLTPTPRVVLFDEVGHFIRAAPGDWRTATAIFRAVIDFWRATPTPLSVLLRGTGGRARAVPRLEQPSSNPRQV